MKIIPYRSICTETEDDFNDIYEFQIIGNVKNPYIIKLAIDNFNNTGYVASSCTCDDCKFKRIPNCKNFVGVLYECKHIIFCKKILNEHGIKT